MFNVTRSFNGTAFKLTHAVIAAAVVAGIFTAVTGPGDRMVVSAVATPASSATKACDGTWPYLNCGQSGDQTVRVIKIN